MLKTLDQALKILNLFTSDKKSWSAKDIAAELKIPMINAYRILETFTSNQYLSKDKKSKQYELGPTLAIFGYISVKKFNVYELVYPYLKALSSEINEAVYLIKAIDETGGKNIDSILPENKVSFSLSLNKKIPLYSGAGYWSILAYLPEDKTDKVLSSEFANLLNSSQLTPSVLKSNLNFIRENGWGYSMEITTPDVFSIASPIFSNKKVIGSIDVAIPKFRVTTSDISQLGKQVKKFAGAVSKELTMKNINLDFYTFFKNQKQ
ncbi:IclR family transcriptional regulator [Liquorilactobacillus ghanensis]|uniref:IclR family transcriptional regulator n=1 Tax=Liquorilactobacillus ghanensis TaxID=399370 RepID=UPI0039EB516E